MRSRFGKWAARNLERFLRRYYEGADPPDRLSEMVVVWANEDPLATRQEWLEYAQRHANNCYRAGFQRGMEYIERDPEWYKDVDPEYIADQVDPNWRWQPEVQLHFPEMKPPEEPLDEERVKEFFARHYASHERRD